MDFDEIFAHFFSGKDALKVIHVASCDETGHPNSAPKMLIEVEAPSWVYFLDFKSTKTHANILANPNLSISFMDDPNFIGYRLNGVAEVLPDGDEFDRISKIWDQRLIKYEADRMLTRIKGSYSTHEGENKLPKDFDIIKFTATEGALVKPNRILRAISE